MDSVTEKAGQPREESEDLCENCVSVSSACAVAFGSMTSEFDSGDFKMVPSAMAPSNPTALQKGT
jgi:hypothetical protein